MKKNLLGMVAILVLAFAMGGILGVISPTEVKAGDNPCFSFDQCLSHGPPGSGGCPLGVYETWSMTRLYGGCCGTLLNSSCFPL